MSTIDPTTLDPTKPTTGEALTADVRANELATQNNLAAAKADIEAVEAHVVDTANPHGVTAAQAGADPAGTAAAAVTAHEGAADPHPVYLTGAEGNAAYAPLAHVSDATNPHSVTAAQAGADPAGTAAGAVAAHEAAGDPHTQYLQSVAGDTTPQLGGALESLGNDIVLNTGAAAELGRLVGETGFVALARTVGGAYTANDGAIVCELGSVTINGAAARVNALTHAVTGGRQVYVSQDGALYGVDPPDPGWIASDTDAGIYDIGSGATLGPWVALTGLVVTAGGAVQSGDRLDLSFVVEGANKSGTQTGTIDIGFGIDGAQPATASTNEAIPAGFDGTVTGAFSTTTVTLAGTETIGLWARINSGSNVQFGFDADGTLDVHELIVSVPGAGGGGGGISEAPIDGTPYARQDAGWVSATGAGDVTGPASAVNGNIAVFSGTTGKLIADGLISSASFEAAGAVAAHEAAGNPHPVYLTAAEGDAAYDAIGSAAAVQTNLDAHEGAGGIARHPIAVQGIGGEGFMPALSNDTAQYLRGDNAWATPPGNIPGPGASVVGNFASWGNTAGTDLLDSGLAPAAFLRPTESATVSSTVGYALTVQPVASGGTLSPDATGGQWIELTGSTATTIALMTDDGAVSVIVPDSLAVTLTGWTVRGTQPASGIGLLELRKFGTNHLAVWAA